MVIPTHERPGLLSEALVSVAVQRLTPTEVVAVDDADDPSTRAVVAEAAASSTVPIRYVPSPHRGAPASRNLGARSTKAPIIAFLDDDDLWHPDHLARSVAALDERPEHDLALSAFRVELDGRLLRYRYVAPGRRADQCLVLNPGVNGSNACLRRRAFERVGGFDEELGGAQDVDLVVRLLREGSRYTVVDEPLVTMRKHGGARITTDRAGKQVARRQLYEKHRAWLPAPVRAHLWLRTLALEEPDSSSRPRALARGAAAAAMRVERAWDRAAAAHA